MYEFAPNFFGIVLGAWDIIILVVGLGIALILMKIFLFQ